MKISEMFPFNDPYWLAWYKREWTNILILFLVLALISFTPAVRSNDATEYEAPWAIRATITYSDNDIDVHKHELSGANETRADCRAVLDFFAMFLAMSARDMGVLPIVVVFGDVVNTVQMPDNTVEAQCYQPGKRETRWDPGA